MASAEEQDDPFSGKKPERKLGPDGKPEYMAPMREEHFLKGSTDFHKAAALLKIDEVKKLLAAGNDDVDTGDVLEQTPLLLLSRNHYDESDIPKAVEMIELLLASGATVVDEEGKIRRDQYGDGLLHLAAMASGHNGGAIVKALVPAFPDPPSGFTKARLVSARCKNFGNSALHWATLGGDVDACECLLAAGADVNRKNRQKESIIDYAKKYEHVKLKVKYEALVGDA